MTLPSPPPARRSSSRGRNRLATAGLALLVFGFAPAAFAIDSDGDLVDDLVDNCLYVPNGPGEMSNQVDTDLDGYGNACDGDFTGDGLITTADGGSSLSRALVDGPLFGADLVADHDGDGHGTLNDLMLFLYMQVYVGVPGP